VALWVRTISWTTAMMLFGSKSVEIYIHLARHGKITTIIIFIDPYDDRSSYEINDFGLVAIKVPTTPQPVIDNKILSNRHSRPCT